MFMLLRIEVHPGLLLVGVNFRYSHHTAAQGSGGGLDEYHRRARDRRPVAEVLELKGRVGAAARDGGRSPFAALRENAALSGSCLPSAPLRENQALETDTPFGGPLSAALGAIREDLMGNNHKAGKRKRSPPNTARQL